VTWPQRQTNLEASRPRIPHDLRASVCKDVECELSGALGTQVQITNFGSTFIA